MQDEKEKAGGMKKMVKVISVIVCCYFYTVSSPLLSNFIRSMTENVKQKPFDGPFCIFTQYRLRKKVQMLIRASIHCRQKLNNRIDIKSA